MIQSHVPYFFSLRADKFTNGALPSQDRDDEGINLSISDKESLPYEENKGGEAELPVAQSKRAYVTPVQFVHHARFASCEKKKIRG